MIMFDNLNEQSKSKEELEKAIREKYKKKRKILKKEKEKIEQSMKDTLIDVAKQTGEEAANELRDTFSQKASNLKVYYYKRLGELLSKEKNELAALKKGQKIIKGSKYTIAGTIAAGLILASARLLYKQSIDYAKRKCSNYKGKDKEICIKQMKIQALKNKLSHIKKSINKCNKSKNINKCKDKLHEEILKIQDQINELIKDIGSRIGKFEIYQ